MIMDDIYNGYNIIYIYNGQQMEHTYIYTYICISGIYI